MFPTTLGESSTCRQRLFPSICAIGPISSSLGKHYVCQPLTFSQSTVLVCKSIHHHVYFHRMYSVVFCMPFRATLATFLFWLRLTPSRLTFLGAVNAPARASSSTQLRIYHFKFFRSLRRGFNFYLFGTSAFEPIHHGGVDIFIINPINSNYPNFPIKPYQFFSLFPILASNFLPIWLH